ncbi:hypothetical protein [uncultured Methylophaga sp.]|uniref:hypothetical protein n=1 Tax=uncultured Methylophaga sp. TaxID=285271 RepID=UPI0030FC5CAB
MATSSVTLQPGIVTLVVSSANNFRIENKGNNTVRVMYSDTLPLIGDDGWGTLPAKNIELRAVDGNFYAYCPQLCELSVAESAIPA